MLFGLEYLRRRFPNTFFVSNVIYPDALLQGEAAPINMFSCLTYSRNYAKLREAQSHEELVEYDESIGDLYEGFSGNIHREARFFTLAVSNERPVGDFFGDDLKPLRSFFDQSEGIWYGFFGAHVGGTYLHDVVQRTELFRASTIHAEWVLYQVSHFIKKSTHALKYSRAPLAMFRLQSRKGNSTVYVEPDEIIALKKGLPSLLHMEFAELHRKWKAWQITNFEYLVRINHFAGRYLGNPDKHPFLPWVWDFASGRWRDLELSKYRLNKGDDLLRMSLNSNGFCIDDGLSLVSYYIYTARVTPQFLLRHHIRTVFNPREFPSSIERFYGWSPDECIPEFYAEPRVFVSMHSGMEDIRTPPGYGSPREFCRRHLEMLEGPEVSHRINHWIDLYFGYKLTGEASRDSLNVAKLVSPGVDGASGLVQLFSSPHPARRKDGRLSPEALESLRKLFHRLGYSGDIPEVQTGEPNSSPELCESFPIRPTVYSSPARCTDTRDIILRLMSDLLHLTNARELGEENPRMENLYRHAGSWESFVRVLPPALKTVQSFLDGYYRLPDDKRIVLAQRCFGRDGLLVKDIEGTSGYYPNWGIYFSELIFPLFFESLPFFYTKKGFLVRVLDLSLSFDPDSRLKRLLSRNPKFIRHLRPRDINRYFGQEMVFDNLRSSILSVDSYTDIYASLSYVIATLPLLDKVLAWSYFCVPTMRKIASLVKRGEFGGKVFEYFHSIFSIEFSDEINALVERAFLRFLRQMPPDLGSSDLSNVLKLVSTYLRTNGCEDVESYIGPLTPFLYSTEPENALLITEFFVTFVRDLMTYKRFFLVIVESLREKFQSLDGGQERFEGIITRNLPAPLAGHIISGEYISQEGHEEASKGFRTSEETPRKAESSSDWQETVIDFDLPTWRHTRNSPSEKFSTWKLNSKVLLSRNVHKAKITSIDISLLDRLLVTSSLDRRVGLWNYRFDGDDSLGFLEHPNAVSKAEIMGKVDGIVSLDGIVNLWDIHKQTQIHQFTHRSRVTNMVTDQRYRVFGSLVRDSLYKIRSLDCRMREPAGMWPIPHFGGSPDSRGVTGSKEGLTGSMFSTGPPRISLSLSEERQVLAYGFENSSKIGLMDLRMPGKILSVLSARESGSSKPRSPGVSRLKFWPGTSKMLSLDRNGTVATVWDFGKGGQASPQSFKVGDNEKIVEFDYYREYIVVMTRSGRIGLCFWDSDAGEWKAPTSGKNHQISYLTSLKLLSKHKVLVVGNDEGAISIIN